MEEDVEKKKKPFNTQYDITTGQMGDVDKISYPITIVLPTHTRD